MGSAVIKQIFDEVKIAKSYSIIFDCTPDLSHQEQKSHICRYVKIVNGKITIWKRVIDLFAFSRKNW